MPISYQIDASHQLVRCVAQGVITLGDLVAHQQKLSADPAYSFQARARILWDFTGTTHFDHSAAKFAETAESWLSPVQIRRALVAQPKSDVAKFLSLWVLHRTVRQDPLVRLFDTIEQAQQWLAEPARA